MSIVLFRIKYLQFSNLIRINEVDKCLHLTDNLDVILDLICSL